jgi:hypothetical protein
MPKDLAYSGRYFVWLWYGVTLPTLAAGFSSDSRRLVTQKKGGKSNFFVRPENLIVSS